MHIHKITFRGTLPLDTWNRLIQFLSDNKIPYKTIGTVAPTMDDAGMFQYYDSVIFWHDKYIPYITNRKKISVKELIERIKS